MASLGVTVFLYASPSLAEDFYKWVDEAGVVHFGSMPPQGVEATKMKSYGKSKKALADEKAKDSSAENESGKLPPEEIERRRKVAEKMKSDCKNEKERLEALNKPGRIRMDQGDGKSRYLSQDEIYEEIRRSRQRIKETCQ